VLPFVLDPQEALKEGAPLIHKEISEQHPQHTTINIGNYDEASKSPG
jgi:xanthine dehydrogenase molybdenum-binding subunit